MDAVARRRMCLRSGDGRPRQGRGPRTRKEFDAMIFCRTVLTALVVALASAIPPHLVQAAEPTATDAAMTSRVEALIPKVEAYSTSGMEAFDVPGLALGIVVGDKLVYAKGFGVRSKSGGQPVDTRTIFQIGSTTKAFLAASFAIMADRGKLKWDDRV